MSKLKEIVNYEVVLFGLYLCLSALLRLMKVHIYTIIGTILIIIHPFAVIKFHGKIITCFTGIIVGSTMIVESMIKGTVSQDIYLFVLMYRLLGIIFVVFYILYAYVILTGKLDQ